MKFFEDLDPDLAALFEEDFKAALRVLESGRPAGLLYASGSPIRWVKLKRFSHKVFFETEDDMRLVLGVVSGRRHPNVIGGMLNRRRKP